MKLPARFDHTAHPLIRDAIVKWGKDVGIDLVNASEILIEAGRVCVRYLDVRGPVPKWREEAYIVHDHTWIARSDTMDECYCGLRRPVVPPTPVFFGRESRPLP